MLINEKGGTIRPIKAKHLWVKLFLKGSGRFKKWTPSDFMTKLVGSELSRFKEPTESKEDLLKKQAAKMRQMSQPIVAPNGGQQIEFFTVEGHKIPKVPEANGGYLVNATHTMMYIFATVMAQDKRIKKILNDANFQFTDLDGNQIFPKVKKKRRVKIHAKRRKRKSRK